MNILCDDCFYARNVQFLMDGPTEVLGSAPLVLTRMVIYQCKCGRLYSSRLGYFNLTQGQGVHAVRKLAPCNSLAGEPLYLAEVLPGGELRLRCPKCDYERTVGAPTSLATTLG
jgi:hypothetical protein